MEGKGFGGGSVYIPEKHTDFIFATIAEEGGFIMLDLSCLLVPITTISNNYYWLFR